jgi:hypothetical protein
MAVMDIPTPIAHFFRMKNEHDDVGLGSLFTEAATVVDGGEGKVMQGAEAIKGWIRKSISGLGLYTNIRSCREQSSEWIIDTIMTGDFKASPARFEYFITLSDDRISALRVEFRGSLRTEI